VTSLKIVMFYGAHGLHGRSDDQSAFLMIPPGERYDLAQFEFVMRGVQAAREAHPDLADVISLSVAENTLHRRNVATPTAASRNALLTTLVLPDVEMRKVCGAQTDQF
jgi:hypothetical protein